MKFTGERNALAARGFGVDLAQHPDLFCLVLELERHALSDGVRDHGNGDIYE